MRMVLYLNLFYSFFIFSPLLEISLNFLLQMLFFSGITNIAIISTKKPANANNPSPEVKFIKKTCAEN